MELPKIYILLLVLLLFQVIINSLLTKEIFSWIPSTKKQIWLCLLVWFVPVVGFFLANKFGDLGWLRRRKSSRGPSSIAGGFMAADSILNPGMKHTIEIIEQQKSEVRREYKQADKEDKNSDKNTSQ